MHKHRELTERRVAQTLGRIAELIHGPTAPIAVAACHLGGEPIPAEEALTQKFEPFAVGGKWGTRWGTTWFRFSGTIPDAWRDRAVVALVHLGFQSGEGFTVEGLVWQNGVPTCAINVNRMDVPISAQARPGETFEFFVEAAANPPQATHGEAALAMPEPQSAPEFHLQRAELACFQREIYDAYHDLKVGHDTMLALSPDEPRRAQLLAGLNEAVNCYDSEASATLADSRRAFAPLLQCKNSASAHTVSAIGHAHIDTAWLWPLRETIRKCARTFSTQLTYMEEYPEFIFAGSQAQQYAWMQEYYPTIFEGIKLAIARGQWEPIGSMWVECDCNLASGESLVRQILYGKKFFQEEFGVETVDVWIPDVFGYSASMPQIMQQAGVRYFLTQKISWNQFNKFPHHTFLWEGIDGTRIFTHFLPADTYNADFSPQQLAFNVRNFKEHGRATRSLYAFGFGDGGGGPTKEMLEVARRVRDLEGLPKVELEKVRDFFPKAEADARDLPVWVGELYLESHRGTYTTQAKTKRGNRRSEFLLRDAEFFQAISPSGDYAPPEIARAVYDVTGKNDARRTPAGDLERAWKLLLLNQFHDIIPGSSIHWVYDDAARDYATIEALAAEVLEGARRNLVATIDTSAAGAPAVIFNTLSHSRREIVALPDGALQFVEVPPCGYRVIDCAASEEAAGVGTVRIVNDAAGIVLDNGIVRATLDQNGFLSGLFDHRVKREALPPLAQANVFQLHDDHPIQYDAWDLDLFSRERTQEITQLERLEVVESDPLRAAVEVERTFGKSRLRQRIVLRAGSPRLDFETEVDWQETHKCLKVAFPVNIRSARATCEIQYGHTERPTHFNTSWDMARFEVCAQKWVDLSEAGYGVALLNDCKYGHDIFGNVIRLSLLRAPTAPDPLADRGLHHFTYALLPHPGDLRAGGVIAEAYGLNNPLQVVPAQAHAGSLPPVHSFFSVDRPNVILEALKPSEAGDGLIVRCYESHGGRGSVVLSTGLPLKGVARTDLLEKETETPRTFESTFTFDLGPFEIATFKLTA